MYKPHDAASHYQLGKLNDQYRYSKSHTSNYSAVWVWLDVETTGLDFRSQTFGILEIAAVITDSDLNTVAELHLIVHQPESVLESASSWCKQQFASRTSGGNGLFDLCRSSVIDQQLAGQQLIQFIEQNAAPRKHYHINGTNQENYYRVLLAGSSVYFDRSVLVAVYPEILNYISHKTIDTTSLLETARRFKPQALRFLTPPKNHHRACEDIHESIALFQWFFRNVIVNC